jgi:ELWxxDGT repeat protein
MPPSSRQLAARAKNANFFTPLRLESLEERVLLTLTAQVIKDINAGPAGVFPSGPVVEMGGVGYFVGNTAPTGGSPGALWRTDGTPAGTRMVKDLLVKTPDTANTGDTASLVNVNGTLFFAARQPGTGYELWKSDGTTAGTTLLKDFGNQFEPVGPRHLTNVNGKLFFAANDGVNGYELWKSDGTTTGTMLLKDIRPGAEPQAFGPDQPGPRFLTNLNGTLFFTANDGTNGYELWKSDGTANGTTLFKNIAAGSANSSPGKLTSFQGNLFFAANDGTNGYELWKSDGTTNGTALLKDINTGPDGSYVRSFTEANGKLFFLASDTVSSVALWKTDGTATGTIVLKDFSPDRSYVPSFYNEPRGLTNVNGTLFFSADDGLGGFGQVWKSDGTVNGTTLVKRLDPGHVFDLGTSSGNFNGTFFFGAYDYSGNEGYELWKSDGTAAGTTLVKDLKPGNDGSYPKYFSAVGGVLYFSALDSDNNAVLWKSDGTSNGTTPVSRAPITASSSQYAFSSAPTPVLGGFEYFAASDGNTGNELWRTDGTSAGTTLVTDLNPGAASSHPGSITTFNGKLFFAADDGGGNQLWMSDGTANGTSRLFNPANPFSGPADLTAVGTSLFFTARDSTFTRGLWKTDGTIAGTVPVSNTPQFGYLPSTLTNVNGTLYFSASDATNGIELWKSDGTSNGTGLVKDIYPGPFGSFPEFLTNFNGTLFFMAGDQSSSSQLYKSNGTAAGTTPITGALPGPAVGLVNVGGTLFFSSNDGVNGYELWRSNGTQAGTSFVKDINPGPASSYIANLTNVNGTLYFNANDGTHGFELWRSNGTAAGTVQVADIAPGSGSSQPDRITLVNSRVVFVADDGLHGREPMTILDVNAAPSFTKGQDQNATDEDGPKTIPGWATGISVGPADEAGQTAAFSVQSNTNPGLFTTPPAIDSTGQLTYTPKPNVSGSAQITILLKDSGGTANGGNDSSATQSFTINVTKPHAWYNTVKPLDVNNDHHVFPNDALAIINYINAFGHGDVPANAQIGQPWGFIDTDHDNHINPTDALKVINVINAGQGGEGEADSAPSNLDELINLLASDPQSGASRRRS